MCSIFTPDVSKRVTTSWYLSSVSDHTQVVWIPKPCDGHIDRAGKPLRSTSFKRFFSSKLLLHYCLTYFREMCHPSYTVFFTTNPFSNFSHLQSKEVKWLFWKDLNQLQNSDLFIHVFFSPSLFLTFLFAYCLVMEKKTICEHSKIAVFLNGFPGFDFHINSSNFYKNINMTVCTLWLKICLNQGTCLGEGNQSLSGLQYEPNSKLDSVRLCSGPSNCFHAHIFNVYFIFNFDPVVLRDEKWRNHHTSLQSIQTQ